MIIAFNQMSTTDSRDCGMFTGIHNHDNPDILAWNVLE